MAKTNPKYIVLRSPHDGLWYVLGLCGGNKYMPVSIGYKLETDAKKFEAVQDEISKDALKHICTI